MPCRIAPNHPKRSLLFYLIDQEVADPVRNEIRAFVERLGASRDWVLGPPELVHESDEQQGETIEMIGGELWIHSALGPHRLPREIDLAHLDEVAAVMDALQRFSREKKLCFAVELDGELILEIVHGDVDGTPSDDRPPGADGN